MKSVLITLVGTLFFCLAGCHATRPKDATSAVPAAATSSQASKTDKSIEKSRNAMLDKSMNVQDEHWASSPATSSTAAAPASASSAGKLPSGSPAAPPKGAAH